MFGWGHSLATFSFVSNCADMDVTMNIGFISCTPDAKVESLSLTEQHLKQDIGDRRTRESQNVPAKGDYRKAAA